MATNVSGWYLGKGIPNKNFDRIVVLAKKLTGCNHAFLGFPDSEGIWFKSRSESIPQSKISANDPFYSYLLGSSQFQELKGGSKALDQSDFLQALNGYGYLAVQPLLEKEGEVLGYFVVADSAIPENEGGIKESLAILSEAIWEHIRIKTENFEDRLLSKALSLSQDLISVIRFDGKFIKVNKAFETLLGYGEAALSEKPMADYIHPEDVEQTMVEINKLIKGEVTTNFSHRLKTKDGVYKTFAWTATGDLKNKWIFAIGRDISQERDREKGFFRVKKNFVPFSKTARG